jgi:hypothetical protein
MIETVYDKHKKLLKVIFKWYKLYADYYIEYKEEAIMVTQESVKKRIINMYLLLQRMRYVAEKARLTLLKRNAKKDK